MNEGRIQTILLVMLALLCGYFVLFGRTSSKDAVKLTNALQVQVDSMRILGKEYRKIHLEYVVLHDDLSKTRDRVDALKRKLEGISNSNITSVNAIKRQLNEVIAQYDSIDYRLRPSSSNDDLTFD